MIFIKTLRIYDPNLISFSLLFEPSNSSYEKTNKTLLRNYLRTLLKCTHFEHQKCSFNLVLNINNLSSNHITQSNFELLKTDHTLLPMQQHHRVETRHPGTLLKSLKKCINFDPSCRHRNRHFKGLILLISETQVRTTQRIARVSNGDRIQHGFPMIQKELDFLQFVALNQILNNFQWF